MTEDVKAAQPSGAEKTTNTRASQSTPPEDHRPLDREQQKLMEDEHVQAAVERLTSGPDPVEEETPEPEPDPIDNTPTDTETETKPDTSTDKPVATKAPEDPPAKADPKPTEVDTSYPDEKELKGYTGNSQRRIRQLVAARKSVEEKAAKHEEEVSRLKDRAKYRDDMEARLTEHKIDPKAWDQWTSLGLLVQQEPGKAAQILAAMAKNLGLDPSELADPKKADDAKLDADLAEMVASFDMTEPAAAKIQASRRKSPAPAQRFTPERAEAQELRPAPSLSVDPVAVGNQAILAVDTEYRKKYPDQWDKMVDDVMTEMAQYKGSPPHLWGKLARDCAERVVKRKVSAAVPPDPSMRSTGNRRARDEDQNTREGFAEAIASGKFFST